MYFVQCWPLFKQTSLDCMTHTNVISIKLGRSCDEHGRTKEIFLKKLYADVTYGGTSSISLNLGGELLLLKGLEEKSVDFCQICVLCSTLNTVFSFYQLL